MKKGENMKSVVEGTQHEKLVKEGTKTIGKGTNEWTLNCSGDMSWKRAGKIEMEKTI